MTVETPISRSQLAELFGLEPEQLVDIVRTDTGWCVVSEDDMQTTGTFPQAAGNTKYGGSGKCPKGGGGKKH